MGDIVQFVDAIGSSPTVRLDLNDGAKWGLNYDGTDFSPPKLKAVWANSVLTDGEMLTASAYENRKVRLSLDLIGSSVDDVASQMQTLWRELNRDRNVLKWQPAGASKPVFLRTIRSSDNQVTDYPGAGTLRTVEMEVEAAPAAYGLKETLAPITVTNDPTTGMYFDLSGIKGDLDTPLVIRLTYGTAPWDGSAISTAVAVRRRGNPANMPFVLQCESMTPGTDTAIQPNDPTYSGSGNNFARTTFVNTAMVSRLSTTLFPAVGGVDVRGDYEVWLRAKGSSLISVAGQAGLGNTSLGPSVTLGNNLSWRNIGSLSLPLFVDPVTDGYGAELPVQGVPIVLSAAGTGTLDWDAVALMPSDDRTGIVFWRQMGSTSADYQYADGVRNVVWPQKGGEVLSGNGSAGTFDGKLPYVSPGVTNRVFWMMNAGDNTPDSLTHTSVLQVSYWPRYLTIAPATT